MLVSWTSLRPKESMSMQRLTMASNSKCFHVNFFPVFAEIFITDKRLGRNTDSRSIASYYRTIFAWLRLVFLILQRFQEYLTDRAGWVQTDWYQLTCYPEPNNPIILSRDTSICWLQLNNLIMISSNHHRGEEETINRPIPHKKPFLLFAAKPGQNQI